MRILFILGAFGFVASLYFLYLQYFVIVAFCIYCITSATIATLLFFGSWMLASRVRAFNFPEPVS